MALHSNMIPGHRTVKPEDFFPGFAEKEISGVSNNIDIWSGPTDIQPEPDTNGYALFVESDSPNDTILGSGIQSVNVHYLDTTGVSQEIMVELDGVTPVDTGVTDCMFVQEFHAATVGAGLVAAGNIDTTSGSAGVVTQRILVATNQSMSTMRQVPLGKKLILTGWSGAGVATTVKIANIRLRTSSNDRVSIPGVYLFLDSVRVKDTSSPWTPLIYEIPAFACVKISVWTDGTLSMSAKWNGYLQNA